MNPDDDLREVLLVGFGAVGAMYAYILQRSKKARVTVVSRGRYQPLIENGLHIKSGKYGEIPEWRPYRVLGSVADALDRPYDYVVSAAKAVPEVIRTPDLVAPLLKPPYSDKYPQPTYVLMQNGINVEVDLYNALKSLKPAEEPRIISCAVYIGTTMHDGEKIFVEQNKFDRISMGVHRPSSTITVNSPEETALLTGFADLLSTGGTDVTIVPEIQRVKYTKNVWNVAYGITAALTRFPTSALFLSPSASTLPPTSTNTPAKAPTEPFAGASTTLSGSGPMAGAPLSAEVTAHLPSASPAITEYTLPWLYDTMMEVVELGNVLFPVIENAPVIDAGIITYILEYASKVVTDGSFLHRPSTLVDVDLGRPTEVEVIIGELVRMARQRGVAVPRLETLYALMLIVQNQLLHGKS